MLFDYLVVGQVIPFNPVSAVRGPKHKVKTPVLFSEDANLLFNSIDTSSLIGLRDKAILSVMTYSFESRNYYRAFKLIPEDGKNNKHH